MGLFPRSMTYTAEVYRRHTKEHKREVYELTKEIIEGMFDNDDHPGMYGRYYYYKDVKIVYK